MPFNAVATGRVIIAAAVLAITAAILTPIYYNLLESAGINSSGGDFSSFWALANAIWIFVWLLIFSVIARAMFE